MFCRTNLFTRISKYAKMATAELFGTFQNEVALMYTKDKTQRITLRLNDEQFAFVKMNADDLQVSPSDFLRMIINASLASYKRTSPMAEETLKQVLRNLAEAVIEAKGKGERRENEQTNINDIVQQ